MNAVVLPFAFAAEFRDEQSGPVTLAALEQEVADLRLQLADARERGLADGRAEALALLQSERDTALLAATQALATALATLDFRFEDTERKIARLGAELALDLADHLAGQALERDPASGIDALIGRALTQVRRGCPLQIRVAPALVPAIEAMVDRHQKGDSRQLFLSVVADASLADGDARVEWDSGSILLDSEARRAAMAAEIAATLAA